MAKRERGRSSSLPLVAGLSTRRKLLLSIGSEIKKGEKITKITGL